MLVPLYGFLAGDTLGLIVLVQDDETVRDLAERLQQAAAVRVAPRAGAHVYLRGRRLDPDLTVAAAGIEALDRIDVVPASG
jgi:hypothetical protein